MKVVVRAVLPFSAERKVFRVWGSWFTVEGGFRLQGEWRLEGLEEHNTKGGFRVYEFEQAPKRARFKGS